MTGRLYACSIRSQLVQMKEDGGGAKTAGTWSSWLRRGVRGEKDGEGEETQGSTASESSEAEEEEREAFVPPDEELQQHGPPIDFSYRTGHLTPASVAAAVVGEGSVGGLLNDYKLLVGEARLMLAEQLWGKIEAWLEQGGQAAERVRREMEGGGVQAMVDRMRQVRTYTWSDSKHPK